MSDRVKEIVILALKEEAKHACDYSERAVEEIDLEMYLIFSRKNL